MGWHKYFKVSRINQSGSFSPLSHRGGKESSESAAGLTKYPSLIQEAYLGMPNRIERYQNFESMDQDSEINSALDILAEFSTQTNDQDNMCFSIKFKEQPTETESTIIKKQLQSWYYLNEFNKRAFRMFRNVLKYRDQIFIRDPETFKLYYVEMDNVIKIIVNESKGKEPEQYVIRNINPNFENLTVTQVTANNMWNVVPSGPGFNSTSAGFNAPNSPYSSSNRFTRAMNESAINAEHILHLSLTEGLDANWPFGNSILELIFKVYKQKELLEDSIIIYRVQRAPERRVFKIDVGEMPAPLAMHFIEKFKNEIHQRRIPGRSNGQGFLDSSYQGMAPNMDFYFPITSNGRGSSVEQLPGGCLAMNTGIPLLDGRTLTLSNLTQEYNEGKENWVYSCNPETGKIEPGIISWAGVTHESAKVMRITLSNGKNIIATPEHKWPIWKKGKIETQNLKKGDNVISLSSTNVYIENIEYLEKFIQVGTLTIDKNEIYHNYHTFALSCGIFSFNSNLNEIDDLKFFTNKMMRGLRIPSSYLPTGQDESPGILSDGRVGTALIQEFRFNQYCERLQKLICDPLDVEFKAYLKWTGINIDSSLFKLTFNPPQNFAHYRQAELDASKIGTFTQLEGYSYFSKRWLMQRYLGMTPDEIVDNQKLWREENFDVNEQEEEPSDMRNLGITPGGIDNDMQNFEGLEGENIEGENPEGIENAEGVEGGGVGEGTAGATTNPNIPNNTQEISEL